MSWLSESLSSSIGRKLMMALTGLFLIIFLVVHLAGNLQLLIDDGGVKFNAYSHFMATNPLIRIISIILYLAIILHVIWSIMLTVRNRKARPVGYAVKKGSANSVWTSRNMGILGTIVLIFLVIHMKDFWYQAKFGELPQGPDGNEDLYAVVRAAFAQGWYVALYVVCMVGLAFHLSHGFSSAFQTLGINHKKYTPFIKKLGIAFAIIIPAGFALIPVIMYFRIH